MKKIYALLAAVVCGMAINAKTIYLNTGGASLWNQADAVFFAHSWDAEDNDVQMTLVSGDIYSAEIPEGNNHILFVRMPAGSATLDWDKKWNQTSDLQIPSGMDTYTITGWGDADGTWSSSGSGGQGGGDNPGGQGGGDNPGGQGGSDNPGGQGGGEADAYWYFVDGQDINNEIDGGIFDCGVSSITVASDGYIFVVYQVHGVPGVQYMSATYVDGPTHATMTTTGAEKLHIPAGTYTLYLYDNGDGSVELSMEELSGKTLVGCGAQGIEQTQVTEKAHKTIVNGQLRIIVGEKMYDVTGKQVEK